MYLTTGCFDKGGISRFSRYQISAWRDLFGGENVSVFSVLGPDGESFETPISVKWHGNGRLTYMGKVRFIASAVAECLKRKPGIVHAAHINLSALAHAAARSVGAKSVINVYGLEVWSSPRADARWGLRHADQVISDCHFTASFIQRERLRSGDTTVIWDCVDTSRFSPGPPKPEVLLKYGIPDPASGLNLLTFGRLSIDAAHKGYERLLHVFADLAGQYPQLRLIYAGRGSLAETLRSATTHLGLSGRVFFTGMIDDTDLPDVYRSAHIFSLVSDRGPGRGEGIPLTPLEAAACGLPLLVGNQDGSQEAVIDGENGFICDPFDMQAHGERIVRLLRDDAMRRRMGRCAQQRIVKHFGYETFVDAHRGVYAALQERGRS